MVMKNETRYIAEYQLASTERLEKAIITACVFNTESCFNEAKRMLSPEMFLHEQTREIWKTLLDMEYAGERVSAEMFSTRVNDVQLLTEMADLLTEGVPDTMAEIQDYCSQLKMSYIKSLAYDSAVKMLGLCKSTSTKVEDITQMTMNLQGSIRDAITSSGSVKSISEVFETYAQELEKRQRDMHEGKCTRVPTSLPTLDLLTHMGFGSGKLVILAARPSIGKTALLLQIVRTAFSHGKTPLVFSLEMENTELGERLLLNTGYLSPMGLATGNIDWNKFDAAVGVYEGRRCFLDDRSRNIDEITSKIIFESAQGNCDIAMIDYLQLMNMGKAERRDIAIGEVTKRLKQVAKDCGIPIILLSQLSRSADSEGRTPQLFDLRESGNIEQDADIVLMMNKPTQDSINELGSPMADLTPDNVRFLWVRKNRGGKGGNNMIPLRANETFTEFTEIELNAAPERQTDDDLPEEDF